MNWPFWSPRRTSEHCESIEPLLPLYADGMATPSEMRLVEAHLPGCVDCRAALSWIQVTHSALASRPVAIPPADLHSRIAQAIAASSAAPGTLGAAGRFAGPGRPVRSFVLRSAYAAAASVTALGLALSYPLWHLSPHSTVNPAPPALTASAVPPAKPSVRNTAPRVHPAPVSHSPSPLVASAAPKSRAVQTVPLTRKTLTAVIPHEDSVPQETTNPQIASVVPATHPAVTAVRVKVTVPPLRVTPHDHSKVASTKTVPSEKHLPVISDIAPKTAAPKISDTPQIAAQYKEHVPATVAPATLTVDPPSVKTASSSHSDDPLDSLKASLRAGKTMAIGKSDYMKRQASLGLANAEQSMGSNPTAFYSLVYSKTAEK